MATPNLEPGNDGPIDVLKQRGLFIGISLALLLPGLFFIISNLTNPTIQAPVPLGIDFRGGTLLEYGFAKKITQKDLNDIRTVFDEAGYTGSVVQLQENVSGLNQTAGSPKSTEADSETTLEASPAVAMPETADQAMPSETPSTADKAPQAEPKAVSTEVVTDKTPPTTEKATAETATVGDETPSGIASIVSIRSKQLKGDDADQIRTKLAQQYGTITLLQKNSIGPSLANELLTNGLLALLFAYILIVGYLTFRFQFDYAVCAIIALLHDSLFVFGVFAMLGYLFHTEVDSLFVTAILTVVGFSVHDTIVVFDRIRENTKRYFTKKVPFDTIVNMSVNQTLARSINTSLTALLPLVALYLFGGETTKDFVLAIILGIIVGTYSSICVASMLLAWWRGKGDTAPAGRPATA